MYTGPTYPPVTHPPPSPPLLFPSHLSPHSHLSTLTSLPTLTHTKAYRGPTRGPPITPGPTSTPKPTKGPGFPTRLPTPSPTPGMFYKKEKKEKRKRRRKLIKRKRREKENLYLVLGTGLQGAYSNSSGIVVVRRVDPTVNFNWGSSMPLSLVCFFSYLLFLLTPPHAHFSSFSLLFSPLFLLPSSQAVLPSQILIDYHRCS